MATRIIQQCDRCGKTAEQGDIPDAWATAEIALTPFAAKLKKMWCEYCWQEVNARLPKASPNG